MLQEMNSTTGTTVKYINGGTEVEDRETVRKLAASGENMIILASSSLFSTGTNIPTITNIIFAMPSKSSIRIRQSIGRGLRLHKSKNVCTIYDIADDLRSDRYMNRTYSHMLERLDIYRKDEFDFKMKSIKLEYDERTDNPF
jgi:superfamily II DNA or RNA helicase